LADDGVAVQHDRHRVYGRRTDRLRRGR
jgi:hypothetical protein